MSNITLVAESKLYVRDNLSLYTYFDDYSRLFSFLVRRCVHHLRHKLNGVSESKYRTDLMIQFKLTNRMAKAIITVVGKDIVIEDLVSLDSNKKQEKTTSKDYNRMINSLKFGLFKRFLLSKATKEGVSVHIVNPYNTSKIARKSYTNRMKLNVHDAASYVIARRFYQYD